VGNHHESANRRLLKVTLEDVVEADMIFTTLMGDKVEPRKNFIEAHALESKEPGYLNIINFEEKRLNGGSI